MIAPLFAATVLAVSLVSAIKQFRLLEKSQLPGIFLQHLCGRPEEKSVNKDCLEDFNKDGAVWAGDVNDDGVDEFIIDAGGMPDPSDPLAFLCDITDVLMKSGLKTGNMEIGVPRQSLAGGSIRHRATLFRKDQVNQCA